MLRLRIADEGKSITSCAFLKNATLITGASGALFAAAERKLLTEVGPARLESVQARLAQCLYLLSSSQINRAWYLFGSTAQLILSLGLHRQRSSRTSSKGPGLVELETRKRVFWSAYTLDKYFSVMLGRPGIFRDEDVDQDFPDQVNDADLIDVHQKPALPFQNCVMSAPVYHAKSVTNSLSLVCHWRSSG